MVTAGNYVGTTLCFTTRRTPLRGANRPVSPALARLRLKACRVLRPSDSTAFSTLLGSIAAPGAIPRKASAPDHFPISPPSAETTPFKSYLNAKCGSLPSANRLYRSNVFHAPDVRLVR